MKARVKKAIQAIQLPPDDPNNDLYSDVDKYHLENTLAATRAQVSGYLEFNSRVIEAFDDLSQNNQEKELRNLANKLQTTETNLSRFCDPTDSEIRTLFLQKIHEDAQYVQKLGKFTKQNKIELQSEVGELFKLIQMRD